MQLYLGEIVKSYLMPSTAGGDLVLHVFVEKLEAEILWEFTKFVFLHSETLPCFLVIFERGQ